MKKLLVLALISTVIVSCQTKKAKDYACKEFSTECELQKDQVLIMPIVCDTTAMDVFGEPVVVGKNQWYLMSTKVRVPIPVEVPVPTRYISVDAGYDYDRNPSPLLLLENWGTENCKIDTIDLKFVHGIGKVVIVVSGVNEIAASSGIGICGYGALLAKP